MWTVIKVKDGIFYCKKIGCNILYHGWATGPRLGVRNVTTKIGLVKVMLSSHLGCYIITTEH